MLNLYIVVTYASKHANNRQEAETLAEKGAGHSGVGRAAKTRIFRFVGAIFGGLDASCKLTCLQLRKDSNQSSCNRLAFISKARAYRPRAKDPPNSQAYSQTYIQAYLQAIPISNTHKQHPQAYLLQAMLTSIYIKQSRSKTHKTKQTHIQ